MNAQNKGLNEMAQDGWTPTKHGESLDCYNRKSMGGGYSQPSYAESHHAITGTWSLTATANHNRNEETTYISQPQ